MDVTIEDYRSLPDLDAELAELGYASVLGWPDQRAVTGSVMEASLRPISMTATTLVLHRSDSGKLLGAIALRWPASLDADGLLWGPMVHPSAQRGGIGRRLLAAADEVIRGRPGSRFLTAEIPESRGHGWAMFANLGWPIGRTSSLMARPLPAETEVTDAGTVEPGIAIRPARTGEYLDAALATLYAACYPDEPPSVARDTFARWSRDSRYRPDGLLLAEVDHRLVGAALVHSTRHPAPDEPVEARIADLLTCDSVGPQRAGLVRAALIAAAVRRAEQTQAEVVRMVSTSPEVEESLRRAGFASVERFRHYRNPL